MRQVVAAVFACTAVLALSGCQMGGPERAELSPRPQGIEGRWMSAGGPVSYYAEFTGGRFRSIESATNAPLAEGTYSIKGPGQVYIEYQSKTRGSKVAANCNQTQPDRLSCASSNGNTFDLVRRS